MLPQVKQHCKAHHSFQFLTPCLSLCCACKPCSRTKHVATCVHAHLEYLCCASPPNAHSQLAGLAVGEQVCCCCADGLHTRAAAPLASECLKSFWQLPAPQPVHVRQRSGRRTAQACNAATGRAGTGQSMGTIWCCWAPRAEPISNADTQHAASVLNSRGCCFDSSSHCTHLLCSECRQCRCVGHAP